MKLYTNNNEHVDAAEVRRDLWARELAAHERHKTLDEPGCTLCAEDKAFIESIKASDQFSKLSDQLNECLSKTTPQMIKDDNFKQGDGMTGQTLKRLLWAAAIAVLLLNVALITALLLLL